MTAWLAVKGVLHCDKASWFGHIEALTLRSVVPVLIVSGDNGLSLRGGIWKNRTFCRCKAHTSHGEFSDG
jgi:hypothetical protein